MKYVGKAFIGGFGGFLGAVTALVVIGFVTGRIAESHLKKVVNNFTKDVQEHIDRQGGTECEC